MFRVLIVPVNDFKLKRHKKLTKFVSYEHYAMFFASMYYTVLLENGPIIRKLKK